MAGSTIQPVLHGFAVMLIFWFILLWMYRRKIFLGSDAAAHSS